MEKRLLKPILITTLFFVFISIGNLLRLKGIENVRAIYIVSLLTCGIGIGAFLTSMVIFIKNKKVNSL